MKRAISLLVVVFLIVSVVCSVSFTANAKDAQALQLTAVSGDFEYTVLYDGTAQITGYIGYNNEVSIPSVIDGYTVTSIGENAFSYEPLPPPAMAGLAQTGVSRFKKITEVTIPDTVTSIGDYAFVWCENLAGVILPDSVKSIGIMAFAHCDSLSYLLVGSSLQSIGTNAFASCESLESIYVSPNNRVYDSRGNCNAIIETSTNSLIVGCKTTIIPDSVTSIGDYAFYYKDIDTAIIPDSVTSIGEYAFAYNKNLHSASFSDSLKSIGKGVFSHCENLKYFTIGNSVESIGDYAFCDCKNLSRVIISTPVESIGDYAFYNCKNLRELIIADSVKSIGEYAFFKCTNLVEITIPKSVTSIGEHALGYVFDEKILEFVAIDGFTIYGYNDTQAQRYANDNGINFVSLNQKDEYIIGDTDGDSSVTIVDATVVQCHIAKLIAIPEDRLICADTNKDDRISILDATQIQLFVAKLIPEL